ncbi:apolipoprotein D-like [Panulirus ornatus]|uniref:apolipoprotein D-like n=1 Tax=Panulirus ornatus TaxID=150431 RepID=UPI003A84AFE0
MSLVPRLAPPRPAPPNPRARPGNGRSIKRKLAPRPLYNVSALHKQQEDDVVTVRKATAGSSRFTVDDIRTPRTMLVQISIFFLASSSVSCEELGGLLPLEMTTSPDLGLCPTLPVTKNFSLPQYMGRWYEIERFPNPFQDGNCAVADYQLLPNGTVFITNTQLVEGQVDVVNGTATLWNNTSEGRLEVEFPFTEDIPKPVGGGTNYEVVATDYESYAVIYTCSYFGPGFKFEFSWIVARQPTLPPQFLVELKERLSAMKLDVSQYVPTLQGPPTCPCHQA